MLPSCRSGTIPQALLRMNGQLPRDTMEANPFTASGRIAWMAGSDEQCLEACLPRLRELGFSFPE
jgi:hypothetical protein